MLRTEYTIHGYRLWFFRLSYFVLPVMLVLIALISACSNTEETNFISCDSSPKDAQLELPVPAREWGKVGCTRYGHILMAQDKWTWSRSASAAPAFLPADMLNSQTMRDIGNNAYFKEFKLHRLSKADAINRHELFHKWIGRERTSIYPEVWELIAVNESGKEMSLNVFKRPQGGGWGIACIPECDRMPPFVIDELGH
jgi:hypothetical protein